MEAEKKKAGRLTVEDLLKEGAVLNTSRVDSKRLSKLIEDFKKEVEIIESVRNKPFINHQTTI